MLAQNQSNPHSIEYSYRFYLEVPKEDGYILYGNIYPTEDGEMNTWDFGEECTLISSTIGV